jgi:hypothetical protein
MNDRTLVILPPDRIDAWLDPNLTDKNTVQKLISGIEYEPLQVLAVSTAVKQDRPRRFTASIETIGRVLSEPGPLRHHEELLLQRGPVEVTGRGMIPTDVGISRAREQAEVASS